MKRIAAMTLKSLLVLGTWVALALTVLPAWVMADDGGESTAAADVGIQTAPVELDGVVLFRGRVVSAHPAEYRAAAIKEHLEALARDADVRIDALKTLDSEIKSDILAGDLLIMAAECTPGLLKDQGPVML